MAGVPPRERGERFLSVGAHRRGQGRELALVDEQLRQLGRRMWETVGMTPEARADFDTASQIEMLLERTVVTGATMMLRSPGSELFQ